ncbi:MAG: signal peptidase II [Pseudomonadota bacterium]
MKLKYKILIFTVPAVFLLDQITKWMIVNLLPLGERIAIIPGFFDIVHFRNLGAAFGMFSGVPDVLRIPFFYIIAVVATVALAFMYRALCAGERLLPFALSLVFGGIAGNVLDRVRFGAVIDFLSFHIRDKAVDSVIFGYRFNVPLEWPAFNVADAAITIAVALVVITAIKRSEK